MESQKVCSDFEPSYFDQLLECSNHPDGSPFPSVVQIGEFGDIGTDLMDLDCPMEDGEKGLFLNPEGTQNVGVLAGENTELKGFQDDFMEQENCSLTDHLLLGAEALQAGHSHLSSTVAMRLIDIFSHQENGEDPFDRLVLYLAEALANKSLSVRGELLEDALPPRHSNFLAAFHVLQELSPSVKFAHFTANQAILEATEGEHDIHVIDFDIMEGIQWPSLMVDLAARDNVTLRITAILVDYGCSASIQQTGFRLQELAGSINLPFVFNQMVLTKEEDFEEIIPGYTLVANCMINQLHMPQRGNSFVKIFLNGLRKLSPKVVVSVEEELFNFSKLPSMSFVEFFCEALDHYTALSDSLLSGFCGNYGLASRVIEKEFMRTRIHESIKNFPCGNEERRLWGDELPSMNGFRPIPLSSCNVSQAKHLVSLFSGGYWVQNEECRLALCWKSRPLTMASIWVPTSAHSQLLSTCS